MNPNLQAAYRIMTLARQSGAQEDLMEWVMSAVHEWRDPDREWALKNAISTTNILADELQKLTGAPIGECKELVKAERGDSEIAIRIAAILEFAKQLPQLPQSTGQTRGRQW